jgi:HSP20 family protein
MTLIKWNQPAKLTGRRNWVENFFTETDDFFRNMDFDKSNDVPAVNVREEEKNFFIEVAAPGMKKEDFKVELDNGILLISAKTEENKFQKEEGFVRREFNYRNFQRSFWLPEMVSPENIVAHYDQGVLTLTLPKINTPSVSKTKMIQVS